MVDPMNNYAMKRDRARVIIRDEEGKPQKVIIGPPDKLRREGVNLQETEEREVFIDETQSK